jgi:hypothetical protein
MKPEIFAVIWCDFVPLSLPYPGAGEAVAAAQAMRAKAGKNGVTLQHLRAVRLDAANKLHTLWQPEN